MRAAILTVLVVAAPGWTQTLAVRVAANDASESPIRDCAATITVKWTLQGLAGFCSGLKLWSTESTSCAEAGPGTSDTSYETVPAAALTAGSGTGTFLVRVSELPGFRAGSSTPCGGSNLLKEHKVCAEVDYGGPLCNPVSRFVGSPLVLKFDTKPPSSPSISRSEALDGAATIGFTVDADTVTVRSEVQEVTDGGVQAWRTGPSVSNTATQLRIPDLRNGTTYRIRLIAVDAADNPSPESEAVSVTPKRTIGFWGTYRDQGGTEEAGCGVAAGPPLLLALGVWLLRRKRR